MHFKIAYLKLTLFYVLIVMVISVGFSVAIYQISSEELGRGLGRQTGILRDFPMNVPTSRNPIIQDLENIKLQQLEESSNHLQRNLIYFNLLILILSFIISYFLAKRTLKPIEEAMGAQNRFTADASHELKTPLTAMRTEIEVSLRDKGLKISDAKKLLGSNLEEIAKLESLSNALLKLTKLEEEIKLEFKELALSEIITEAFEKVESLAADKNIEFETKFKEVPVRGDRQSLVELFVILLDNAIKYSPKKSKISINIKQEKKHATVSIKDRGIGIKASDLPHIFERFYRADQSRSKEKTDGYGLGLSIAKRIVELHGGEISAKSIPGKGSEFIVKLSPAR